MRARLRFRQIETGSADDDFLLMMQIMLQHLFQRKHLWFAVDQSELNDAKADLHLCMLEQLIEDDGSVRLFFYLNHHAQTFFIAFIAQVCDAFDALFMHQLCNLCDQLRLVHLIGQLVDKNALLAVVHLFNYRTGAQLDYPAAGLIGGADAFRPQDNAGRRKIRAGNEFHQIIRRACRVIDQQLNCTDHFVQVMRRDICRHADRNAGTSVDQQVRQPRRQNCRLLFLTVIVINKIDRIFIEIGHHIHGIRTQARLSITHGSSAVAVHRAEIAMAVDKHITHGKVLRHTDQCIINGEIAMRVIFTHAIADDTGAFFMRLIRRDSLLHHRI